MSLQIYGALRLKKYVFEVFESIHFIGKNELQFMHESLKNMQNRKEESILNLFGVWAIGHLT